MVNMIVTPFAREVKRLRAERGLTIRELASALRKSVAYLAKIEVQGEIPTPDLTCEIARALDASPPELLKLAKEAQISSIARDINREYSRALATHADADQGRPAAHAELKGARTMATVVSMINMKGGVGKTTLAMHLA